jgi:hypothetical protein
MLKDLETVADSDAPALPHDFAKFRDWDSGTLEGNRFCHSRDLWMLCLL